MGKKRMNERREKERLEFEGGEVKERITEKVQVKRWRFREKRKERVMKTWREVKK